MSTSVTRSAADLAAAVARLRDASRDLSADDIGTLQAALASRDPRIVDSAARVVAERFVSACAGDLEAAYDRMVARGARADPGCLAKAAVLEALDFLEHQDPAVFERAVCYRQVERRQDTAGSARARAALALARLGHDDLLPLLGELLADADASVRLAAVTAVAHHGRRDGAGLLLLKLGTGDEEPGIISECVTRLFDLAPDLARRAALQMLRGKDPVRRELAVNGLGAARMTSAVDVLVEYIETCPIANARGAAIRALGSIRLPEARARLLALIETGRASDARAAIDAVALHAYDAQLVASARAAAARNQAVDLGAALAAALPDGNT